MISYFVNLIALPSKLSLTVTVISEEAGIMKFILGLLVQSSTIIYNVLLN